MKKIIESFGIKSEVEVVHTTSECNPEELLIGFDEKLEIGNHLWIPNEFTEVGIPTWMVIIGEQNGLFKVETQFPLIKPIPVGTLMIILQTEQE